MSNIQFQFERTVKQHIVAISFYQNQVEPLCYIQSTKLLRDKTNSEYHFTTHGKPCMLDVCKLRNSKPVLARSLHFLQYCVYFVFKLSQNARKVLPPGAVVKCIRRDATTSPMIQIFSHLLSFTSFFLLTFQVLLE